MRVSNRCSCARIAGSFEAFLMRADLRRRAFYRAVQIVGGKEQLAAYLGVDTECLAGWTTGAVRPPVKVLQSLAQIIRCGMLKEPLRAGSSKKLARAKRRVRR